MGILPIEHVAADRESVPRTLSPPTSVGDLMLRPPVSGNC
jgi:hypothetical protein